MDREKLKELVRRLRVGDDKVSGKLLTEWGPNLFDRLEHLDEQLKKAIGREFDKLSQAAEDPDTNTKKAFADIIERIEGMLREVEATDATRSMWTLVQVGKAKLRVQIDKVCENQWRVWVVGDIRNPYQPVEQLARHLPGDRFPKLEDARASVEKAFKLGGFTHASWNILDAAPKSLQKSPFPWGRTRMTVPFPPPLRKPIGEGRPYGRPSVPVTNSSNPAFSAGYPIKPVPVSGLPDEREDLVERKHEVTPPETHPKEEKKPTQRASWIGFAVLMGVLFWIAFFVRWILGVLGVLDPLF